MNKYSTILGQMIDIISRSQFEKLVKEHKIEHGAKGLRSWTQFVTNFISVIKTMLFQRVFLNDFLCGTSPPLRIKDFLEFQPEFVW